MAGPRLFYQRRRIDCEWLTVRTSAIYTVHAASSHCESEKRHGKGGKCGGK